jgi:hypothetical protein
MGAARRRMSLGGRATFPWYICRAGQRVLTFFVTVSFTAQLPGGRSPPGDRSKRRQVLPPLESREPCRRRWAGFPEAAAHAGC